MARKLFLAVAAVVFTAKILYAQDAQSLADAARKARAEKSRAEKSVPLATPAASKEPELALTFADAAALADSQEKAAETRDYFNGKLMPDFGAKFAPVLQSCFGHVPRPDGGPFAFVAALGVEGKVLRMYRDHATNISECALAELQKASFPRPPVHPYYLHIEMSFPDGGQPEQKESQERLPLVLDKTYSYTFGLPANWEYDFQQAQERGALLAFFPQGGSFSGSKNVIYVNELNDSCRPDCKGRMADAIAQLLKEVRQESPGVEISNGGTLKTQEGGTAEVRILSGSKDPRAEGESKDKEALAIIEHKEAIVLVILTVTDPKSWEQDFKVFQEVVRGHRFFTCDTPSLARPCR